MARHAALLLVCAGLAACTMETGPDLTATRTDPTTAPSFVRSDGRSIAGRSVARPAQARLRPTPRATASAMATTICDAGTIDPNDGSVNGGLDGGTYDNVEVPAGAICVLSGVTVTNAVRALAGSRLFVQSSEIGGNVRGLDASAVQVSGGTTIGGNLNVQGAHDTFYASCSVDDAIITGDLICADNDPGSPIIRTEQGPVQVGGSVRLVDNVIPAGHVMLLLNAEVATDADVRRNGGAGHKEVTGNTITGDLTCRKNDPTFIGGPNTTGSVKGQCT